MKLFLSQSVVVCPRAPRSEHGAKVYLEPLPGTTAVLAAIDNDQQLAVETLLACAHQSDYETATGETNIMRAVTKERWAILSSLVGGFESVDMELTNGDTALLVAVRNGHSEGVQVREQKVEGFRPGVRRLQM